MLVKEAKAIAHQWVIETVSESPDFYGAFYHGSINWLPDDAVISTTSDVDLMLVFDNPPSTKLGKFIYQDLMLEVSYLSRDHLQSAQHVLGQYHLAGSFWKPNIILDPSGQLTKLQAAISKVYTKRKWVYQRCEQAREKTLQGFRLNETDPFHDQVMSWIFATGITTHILLVAGLKNPTVRRRYVATQQLLAAYGYLAFYETLLEILGCAHMRRSQVAHHLTLLSEVFDTTKAVVKTPLFFASDISEPARPLAIDGSWELIENGYHREAIFWIVVTYTRCQNILYLDAPMTMQVQYRSGYDELLNDLGITSFTDLQQGYKRVKDSLPQVWKVAEAIIAANPQIED